MSDLDIRPIKTNNYLLNPSLDEYDTTKKRLKFNGSILNRSPTSINHGKIVNIYAVYEITSNYNDINYPTVKNCLFWSVKLTKNTNINKHRYSGYGIGFDRRAPFSIGNDTGRNVIIFGVDMSSSLLIDNKNKTI